MKDYSICDYFCQYSFYYISQLVRACTLVFPLQFMAQAQSKSRSVIYNTNLEFGYEEVWTPIHACQKFFKIRVKTRHFEGGISSSFSPLNHWRRGSNLVMYSFPPFFNAYFQKLWHSLDYLSCTASSNFRTKGHPHSSRSRAPLFPLSLPLHKPVTQVTYCYRWMPNIY